MKVIYFTSSEELREWFKKNHAREKELWVGFFKRSTGKPSPTWPESVDEALCYGWIDGIRKSVDDRRYKIRFTPRRPGSIWSRINLKKVEELTKLGRMQPAGLNVFNKRDEKKSQVYSFERQVQLTAGFEMLFRKNKKAWAYFKSRAPYYQKGCIHWVMGARQEETRLKRLKILISDSAEGKIIRPMKVGKKE